MKFSFIILTVFVLGIVSGIYSIIPKQLAGSNFSEYALYILVFLVGISIGGDTKVWKTLRSLNFRLLLIPTLIIVGSLTGSAVASAILKTLSLREGLAVGAGLGYYSLTSIIITKFYSETLGVIALMANLFREILTLVFTPALKKYLGKLAPIASGGATTMDTTLPIITQVCGKEYALIAVFNGVVLGIVVPFLVPFIITM